MLYFYVLFNYLKKKEIRLQLRGIMNKGNIHYKFRTVVFDMSSFVGEPVPKQQKTVKKSFYQK